MQDLKKSLALKYRPKNFDELIGQKSVSQTLSLALEQNKTSYAYLFSGLRGSGKTSTARIFAKALVCSHPASGRSCEVCENCRMANEGKHIDIIELDGASNRKIDDVRDLIEQTRYKPSIAAYKIFIIDEVHMLTKEAFNALLKTLEEPPEFVKFILATTDPLKLPPTILSRTQHFRFKKIAHADVTAHLKHILLAENIGYEEPALEMIARSGGGSLRDSLTLLDQAVVYSKGFVSAGSVVEMLGVLDPKKIDEFFSYILGKDRARAVAFVEEIEDQDAQMVLDEIMFFLKQKLTIFDKNFPVFLLERFFRVASQTKSLLFIGSDAGFAFCLMVLKMIEAMKFGAIDDEIRALENDAFAGSARNTASAVASVSASVSSAAVASPAPRSAPTPRPAQDLSPAPAAQTTPSTQDLTPAKDLAPAPKIQDPSPAQTQSAQDLSQDLPPKIPPQDPAPRSAQDPSSHPAPSAQDLTHVGLFDEVVKKIYARDPDLGDAFKASISFVSFKANTLTWISNPLDEHKKMLKKYWPVIKQLIEETFGVGIEIKAQKPSAKPAPKIQEARPAQDLSQDPNPDLSPGGNLGAQDISQDPAPKPQEPSAQDPSQPQDLAPAPAQDLSPAQDELKELDDPFIKTAVDLFKPSAINVANALRKKDL